MAVAWAGCVSGGPEPEGERVTALSSTVIEAGINGDFAAASDFWTESVPRAELWTGGGSFALTVDADNPFAGQYGMHFLQLHTESLEAGDVFEAGVDGASLVTCSGRSAASRASNEESGQATVEVLPGPETGMLELVWTSTLRDGRVTGGSAVVVVPALR